MMNKPNMAGNNMATGSLFDEDDILGVISSNDPMASAAHQSAQASQNFNQGPAMSQQELIFGQT